MKKLKVGYGDVRNSRDRGMAVHRLLVLIKLDEHGGHPAADNKISDRTRIYGHQSPPRSASHKSTTSSEIR